MTSKAKSATANEPATVYTAVPSDQNIEDRYRRGGAFDDEDSWLSFTDNAYDDSYMGPSIEANRYRERFLSRGDTIIRRAAGELSPMVSANHMNHRRAIAGGGSATLTIEEWLRIVDAYEGRCLYCQAPDRLTMDHLVPISRGGDHSIENVVPACRSCNSRKHDRNMNVWVSAAGESSLPAVVARIRDASAALGIKNAYTTPELVDSPVPNDTPNE
jgi:hypothetical protein